MRKTDLQPNETGLQGTAGSTALQEVGEFTRRTAIRIDGTAAGDCAGISVSNAGDINGDGRNDVIVGAYAADDDDPLSALRVRLSQ